MTKTAGKREAIRLALTADPSRSSRDIARQLGCSPQTVTAVRRELETATQDAPRQAVQPEPNHGSEPQQPQPWQCSCCGWWQQQPATALCEFCAWPKGKSYPDTAPA